MIYLLISVAVIAMDQVTKYFIRSMPMNGEYRIIGEFLRIVHVENSGAAFGMFEGNRRFLLVVPVIVIILAAFFIMRNRGSGRRALLEKVSLTLIASGGIGNLIDRIIFGHVTDMISFSIFPPVFNVADIAVTVGCGLLILSLFLSDDNAGNAEQTALEGQKSDAAQEDFDDIDGKEGSE